MMVSPPSSVEKEMERPCRRKQPRRQKLLLLAKPNNEQGGSFDCNICLELAQDPVVTLCGHLFCWPCLYRWLQMHSICQECPVCKASVEEEKVIPLYGRGKIGSVDPRRKTVPGVNNNIPHRPAGQRPETARPTEQQQYQYYQQHHHGFNFMPAAGPAATARFGNITLSAGFGLFPSLFGFQLYGFPDASSLGGGHGFHAAANPVSMTSSYSRPTTQSMMPDQQQQQQEALLSRLLLLVGCFVVLCLLLF
ncbi:unnamed protein product [Sphagnum jensenii]|uniref:RING-type E3 ubiquitin transferase n=1 Tax=Sphagnum jensenii TaxID=128206 RepID=A0ABP1BYD2_9BRYO